jgi:hypothetical protein
MFYIIVFPFLPILFAIGWSVLRITTSNYPFSSCKSLYIPFLLFIAFFALLRFTASGYLFDIFNLFLYIIACPFSFGHCIVWPSSTYGFLLPPLGISKRFLLKLTPNIFLAYESEWLLLNANSPIFQLYHDENTLMFDEMMMKSDLY